MIDGSTSNILSVITFIINVFLFFFLISLRRAFILSFVRIDVRKKLIFCE